MGGVTDQEGGEVVSDGLQLLGDGDGLGGPEAQPVQSPPQPLAELTGLPLVPGETCLYIYSLY